MSTSLTSLLDVLVSEGVGVLCEREGNHNGLYDEGDYPPKPPGACNVDDERLGPDATGTLEATKIILIFHDIANQGT